MESCPKCDVVSVAVVVISTRFHAAQRGSAFESDRINEILSASSKVRQPLFLSEYSFMISFLEHSDYEPTHEFCIVGNLYLQIF